MVHTRTITTSYSYKLSVTFIQESYPLTENYISCPLKYDIAIGSLSGILNPTIATPDSACELTDF